MLSEAAIPARDGESGRDVEVLVPVAFV